ncbi:ABC transporter ATP-binding protein [Actinopolymorpha pittospori]|uniref:ATP-binding cassette subfamily B protein n=1 Tax=Actinopolymorpha pittospori TaxID=648752 RepID=A0A927MXF7_9ACTN|nr:ABC transporter ATP-binding protein [Actinopolymorpha pittospori]MBE1608261.1 ATP-binding cassette subfamily B protein [Actinopolymorpha pittospori]
MKRRMGRWRALLVLLWRAGRWQAVVVGVLAIVQGLLPTGLILATGELVAAVPDAVRQGLDSAAGDRALWALGLVGGAFVAGAILQAITSYQVSVLDNRYAEALHDAVARATLGTPGIAPLEDPRIANEIAALEEVERVDNFLETVANLRQVVQERATGIGAFLILLSFAWWAPFVLYIGWRAVIVMVTRLVEHGVELGFSLGAAGEMRRSRYLRGLAVESAAAKEIRVFGLADWVTGSYAHSWLTSMRRIWRGRFNDGLRTIGAVAVLAVAHVVVLGVLGWEAARGTLSVAQVVVFVQAVLATESLGWVGDPQWATSRAAVVAGQVVDLERRLAAAPSAGPARAAVDGPSGPVAVRLENLSFTYRGRAQPTLSGLDLEIPPGQSLAIVGENGVGKTTLIKLLCGLYDPDAGAVRIDGASPQQDRSRIGVIFQEFVRYELPLRENVGFGNLSLTGEEEVLRRALADAGGADLLATMPLGWDTVLARGYEGGRDLSGGQWQKVALARALTAIRGGAGLLILDEPTANLDVRAETELFDRFLELTRDTTTILVSHRLASVRHADRIVVIDDGRIVEDGTHDELRALGGRYDRMFGLQAQRFAAEAAGTGGGEADA